MQTERRVTLFKNGRNQAVRIPREFEMPGKEVIMRKEGDRLIIEPVEKKMTLVELLASWKPIKEKLPIPDDPPVEPRDIF